MVVLLVEIMKDGQRDTDKKIEEVGEKIGETFVELGERIDLTTKRVPILILCLKN